MINAWLVLDLKTYKIITKINNNAEEMSSLPCISMMHYSVTGVLPLL